MPSLRRRTSKSDDGRGPGTVSNCSHAGGAERLNPDVLFVNQAQSENGLPRSARGGNGPEGPASRSGCG